MARRKSPENPNQGQFDFPGYSTAPQQGFLDFDTGGIGWETPATKQRRNRKPYKKQVKPGPGQQELPFGPAQNNLPTVWKDPNAPAPNPNASKSLVPTGNLPVPTGNLPVPTGNLPVPTGNLPVPYPKPGPEDGPGPKPGPNPSPPGQPGELPSGPLPKPPTNWAQIGNITAGLLTNYQTVRPELSVESTNLLTSPGALQRGFRQTDQIKRFKNPYSVSFSKQDPLGYRRDDSWGAPGSKGGYYSDPTYREKLKEGIKSQSPGISDEDLEDLTTQVESNDEFKQRMQSSQDQSLKPDLFQTDEERQAYASGGKAANRFMAGFTGNRSFGTTASYNPSLFGKGPTIGGSSGQAITRQLRTINPYSAGKGVPNTKGTPKPTPRPKKDYSAMWSGGNPMPGGTNPTPPGGFAGQRTQPGQDWTHGGTTSGTGSAWWDVHTQTVNQPSFRQPRQPRQPGQTYNN